MCSVVDAWVCRQEESEGCVTWARGFVDRRRVRGVRWMRGFV